MDRPKLLIADDSADFIQALIQSLGDGFDIRYCHTGKEALSMLHSFQPDLLVLELMLTELDGISLLQSAIASGCKVDVLVISRMINAYTGDMLSRMNIRYMIRKPCDLEATVDRIRDLIHPVQPRGTSEEPKTQITKMLHALSVPTKLSGYTYLKQAILEMAISPGMPLIKELYPAVASVFGCTSHQVERSMRTAIAAAWENRDEEIWRSYFRSDANRPLPRPTNSEFIILLAEQVRL